MTSYFASSFPERAGVLSGIAKFAAGLTIALGLLPGQAAAGVNEDGVTRAQSLAFGKQFKGRALSFKISVPGVGTGERDTSATFLNSEYAITCAHNVADLVQYNPTYSVADGLNFETDRGTVVQVSQVIICPAYDGTTDTPDIAILKFATPFRPTDANGLLVADMQLGTVSTGDLTYSAGFGRWGTPSIGFITPDGGLGGWDADVSPNLYDFVSPTFYLDTEFGLYNANTSLNGQGASGDSGGPVFNQAGRLVGVTQGGQTDLESAGFTDFVKFTDPTLLSWIAANTQVSIASMSSLAISQTSTIGGTGLTGIATLTEPAGAGGDIVTLSSSNPAAASVGGSTTVSVSSVRGSFPITTHPVSTSVSVTITATFNSTSSTATTIVLTPKVAISATPATVVGGTSTNVKVTLSAAAGPSGDTVTFRSSNATVHLPASAKVVANGTNIQVVATTLPVSASVVVTLTAAIGSYSGTCQVTVLTPTVTISATPSTVNGGQAVMVTVTLSAAAGPSGDTVTFRSSSVAAKLPATMLIPAGKTSVQFNVTTTTVSTPTPITFTVALGSSSNTTTFSVAPP
jgi:hypothetical protein